MTTITLNTGRKIGKEQLCYIIAEIGINHNGSIEIAKQLIDEALIAKVDAVKFQNRRPNLQCHLINWRFFLQNAENSLFKLNS